MTDIVITKLSGDGTDNTLITSFPTSGCTFLWSQTYVFKTGDIITLRNYESVDFELDSPVGDFPIPELRDVENIIVKAEGNRLVISFSWVLIDEPTSIVTSTPSQCVSTVQEQLDFFLNTFQPNSINDVFKLDIDGISRAGTFRKISFSKSSATPVTYSGRMEFIAGDVVAGEA